MVSTPEQVVSYIKKLEKDYESLEDQIADIVVYSNGGVTWTEAWMLSAKERNRIIDKINKKMKAISGDKTEYM